MSCAPCSMPEVSLKMLQTLTTILSLSVLGTVLAGIILLLSACFRRCVSRTVLYYIWLLALLRLCVPLGVELPVLPASWLTQASVQSGGDTYLADTRDFQELENNAGAITPAENAVTQPEAISDNAGSFSTDEFFRSPTMWFCVWLAGVSVSLVWQAGSCIRLARILRRTGELPAQADLALFSGLAGNRRVRLMYSGYIPTPMLVGLFRPVIYIPSRDYVKSGRDGELQDILLHELTHYRRRDLLYKWFTMAVTCLHWFNPFMPFLRRQINRACELSCDEAVIRRLTPEQRRHYGQTLLDLSEHVSCDTPRAAATMLQEKEQLRERLVSILNYRKAGRAAVAVSLLLVLTLTGCALVSGVDSDSSSSAVRAPEETAASIPADITQGPSQDDLAEDLSTTALPVDAIAYAPEQVYGLVSAQFHLGSDIYTVTDGDSLLLLENMFSSAETLPGGAKCPFSSTLYLTREDGVSVSFQPAEDSCATLLSDGVYYRYNQDDNSALWELFGIEQYHTEYEYDEEGRVIRQTDYSWQSPTSIYDYSYDSAGNLIKEVYSSGDGSLVRETEYTYDTAGNLMHELSHTNGEMQYEIAYTYDANGRLLTSTALDANGALRHAVEHTYGEDGRLERTEHISGDGGRYAELYEWQDEQNYTVYTYEDDQLQYSHIYLTDSRGNILRDTMCMSDGSVEAIWEYIYDGSGELTGTSQYTGNGELVDSW